MLPSYMVIVSAKAGHHLELIPIVRSTLTEEMMDPYLALDEDMRLQVICTKPGEDNCYGSQKDEAAAVETLSAVESKDQHLKETLLTHYVSKLENLLEGREPAETYVPKSAKVAEMEKMLKSIEGIPGAPGMKMYTREELMSGKNLDDEDDDDEDDEPSIPSNLLWLLTRYVYEYGWLFLL